MAIDQPSRLSLISTEAPHRAFAHTYSMLHVCVGVLSTTFNSDLEKDQGDPRGYNGYAGHRERVRVSACKNKFVCLPGNLTSCS